LFCVSASSPGAGKSLLTEIAAAIVTGGNAVISTYSTRDPAEWEKKLTAFVKMAVPMRVFDNCNGQIGGEDLDRLVTSSTWGGRILGVTDAPPLPIVTTWWATGNNIEPTGDTSRRVLMCRIEVDTERPQERTGFKYPELKRHALAHRAELLSAALTILRAFHLAERPSQGLPTWGSFETWSDLVRNAIVWAGAPDPFITQRRAATALNEPENEAHDFWLGVVEDSDGFAGTIANMANNRDAMTVLDLRGQVTAFNLRGFLRRFVDKPRRGRRIRARPDRSGQVRYHVEQI
jgi:hypothetical protein